MLHDKHHLFETLVTAGSIAKAAERLNCCRKSLSSAIDEIERSAGVKLIDRHSSGIRLTEPGWKFYDTCVVITRLLQEVEDSLGSWKEQKKRLKIISTTGLTSLWLAPMLTDFMQSHPEIYIELIGIDDQIDLNKYEADLFIRPSHMEFPEFHKELLLHCQNKLYASPEYIAKHGLIFCKSDLKKHKFISYGEEQYRTYKNIDWYKELAGKKPIATVNQSYGACKVASNGLGIINWPSPIPIPKDFNLQILSEAIVGYEVDIHAYYKLNTEKIYLVKEFLDCIKKQININISHGPVAI